MENRKRSESARRGPHFGIRSMKDLIDEDIHSIFDWQAITEEQGRWDKKTMMSLWFLNGVPKEASCRRMHTVWSALIRITPASSTDVEREITGSTTTPGLGCVQVGTPSQGRPYSCGNSRTFFQMELLTPTVSTKETMRLDVGLSCGIISKITPHHRCTTLFLSNSLGNRFRCNSTSRCQALWSLIMSTGNLSRSVSFF